MINNVTKVAAWSSESYLYPSTKFNRLLFAHMKMQGVCNSKRDKRKETKAKMPHLGGPPKTHFKLSEYVLQVTKNAYWNARLAVKFLLTFLNSSKIKACNSTSIILQ